MARDTTPWTERENAYIVSNINRKSVPSIAVALCRPYNETKCHVRYMTQKGMFKDVDMNRKVRPKEDKSSIVDVLNPKTDFEEMMNEKFRGDEV